MGTFSSIWTKPPPGRQINWLHPLSRGLVGCWLFNEGAGISLHDLTGGQNHAVLTNTAKAWTGSKYGYAVDFAGTDDYAAVPNIFNIPNGSVYVRFRFNNLSGEQYIIAQRAASYETGDWLLRKKATVNTLEFFIRTSSNWKLSSSDSAMQVGVWYSVVLTWRNDLASGNMKLYIDSVLQATLGSTNVGMESSKKLEFGRRGDGSANFNGIIDMVQLYDHVLYPSEVNILYQNPYAFMMPTNNRAIYGALPTLAPILVGPLNRNQFKYMLGR